MRRPSAIVAASVLATAIVTGCGTVVSTVFTEVGEAQPAMPAACVEAIGDFLVEIEPIVSNVDFETATEEEISSLGAAMEPAGEAFDPELCPDLEVEESRAAWLAIAAERAPGTAGYIEYTYAGD